MARSKPTATIIADLNGVNDAMREILAAKRELALIEAEMNEAIDSAKARADAAAAPHQGLVKELETAVAAFAQLNKSKLFEDKRTLDLPHGQIGFRRSTELKPNPKCTWDQVLGLLEEQKVLEAIRTKVEVDKEALKKWPDQRLATVGVRRVEKDTFWLEVAAEEVKDSAA